MRILAIEPYHGGSHAAFLEGWAAHSAHELVLLTLPAHHWKWRMRHAAVTLAERAADLAGPFDALWCSDMLNLAAFRGLCPPGLARLPAVLYFHENQLAYPAPHAKAYDNHFGFTNFTSALAAVGAEGGPSGEVWWNSAFNRDSFCDALAALLKRTPKPRMSGHIERIRARSRVMYPGIELIGPPPKRKNAPQKMHLLWAARWEHDKNPELFFEALELLITRGVAFEVSVIGESFEEAPAVFDSARRTLGTRVKRWGYQTTRAAYEDALREADIVVSTADHEFFGLSVVEAVSAGCSPLLPRRLAYPELFKDARFFYDGTASGLADALAGVAAFWEAPAPPSVNRFAWPARAAAMDEALSLRIG